MVFLHCLLILVFLEICFTVASTLIITCYRWTKLQIQTNKNNTEGALNNFQIIHPFASISIYLEKLLIFYKSICLKSTGSWRNYWKKMTYFGKSATFSTSAMINWCSDRRWASTGFFTPFSVAGKFSLHKRHGTSCFTSNRTFFDAFIMVFNEIGCRIRDGWPVWSTIIL